MANIRAIANGNWSNNAIWSPAPPTSVDDVFASGFTVYVDTNIQVLSINTIGATGIGGGGTFRPNNGVVMTTNVVAGSTTCVTFGSAAPNFFSLVGNVSGGSSTSIFGINGTSTGTINITGNIFGGIASTAYGIQTINNIINIRGDIYGGTGGSAHGLIFNSSGTISPSAFIVGNVYNGTGSSSQGINSGGNLANFISLTGNVLNNPAGGTADAINTTTTPGSIVNVLGNVVASGGSARITHNSTGTLNIVGTVSGSPINLNDHRVISNFGSGTVNITGTVINGRSVNGYCVVSGGGGAGTVNIYGDVYGGTVTNAIALYNDGGLLMRIYGNIYARDGGGARQNQANGTIIVYGDVYGGASNSFGVINGTTGTVIISGSAVGGYGTSNAAGATNNSTGILRVKRAVGNNWGLGYTTDLAAQPGVVSAVQGSQTFVEELECGSRGQWPTGGVIFFTPNTKATSMFKTDTFRNYSLIQSNSADNLLPPVSSVRQGTTYNLGLSTGTCIIPPTSSVAAGTLVDNLTGTAVLTPQTTWNYPTTASDVNSMGGRLRNALNTNSANSLINSFNP